MARMEFLSENLVNTTTMITVDSNTDGRQYLFDRSRARGYESINYNSTTATVINIAFAEPTVISHILLQNHTLKDFRLFYNSTTANSIYVDTTNSATSTYLSFSSVTVSSVQLQMNAAITAGEEKSVGELVITERKVQFEVNPSHTKWKPVVFRKQVEHEMPDGGSVLFNIKDKYRASLSWTFITSTFHDQLLSVFNDGTPNYFLPFPTSTGWDGAAYETVWVGDFDFKHATNDKTQGYSGSILLKETPSR